MDPLEAAAATGEGIAEVLNSSPSELLMSEFDKKSLRLLGILAVSGFIILLILYCWIREFFRRNLGFGSKVFSARKRQQQPQKWKKLN